VMFFVIAGHASARIAAGPVAVHPATVAWRATPVAFATAVVLPAVAAITVAAVDGNYAGTDVASPAGTHLRHCGNRSECQYDKRHESDTNLLHRVTSKMFAISVANLLSEMPSIRNL